MLNSILNIRLKSGGKLFPILFFICISITTTAQKKLFNPTPHNEKYFVSASYGLGNSRWVSEVSNTQLYNSDGTLIRENDMNFRIKNQYKAFNVQVSAPYNKVRLGMGIGFENFFLDKLILVSDNQKAYLPFSESFRFDKLTFLVDAPLNPNTKGKINFSVLSTIGYYGFSKVESLNFFGGPYLGNTYFIGTSFVADFEIFPHYFVFVQLGGDYKHFRNNGNEAPTVITHKIFSGSANAGLRINMYNFRFFRKMVNDLD